MAATASIQIAPRNSRDEWSFPERTKEEHLMQIVKCQSVAGNAPPPEKERSVSQILAALPFGPRGMVGAVWNLSTR